MIILHGLFGSSDNWQTLAKKFGEDFEVYLVDQRNHGRSPHDEEHSYESMAQDLYELVRDENLEDFVLVGHSMGGKTAMLFAHEFPGLADKLIVVDMGIKQYPVHHGAILEGLNSMDMGSLKSRGEADELLQKYIPDFGTRQFLLKNMYWESPGQLGWRFNLSALTNNIVKMGEPVVAGPNDVNSLFIYGGKSDYILLDDLDQISNMFPNAHYHCIDQVGHWVHAEAPHEFYSLVTNFALESV